MAYGNSFQFNIQSFEQLEQLYKDTTPIRERQYGITRDIRPISSRTQKHVRVIKIDDDTYGCVLYDTRCVTYHRNGKLEITTNGYNTQATSGFINACMPYGWYAYRIQGLVHIQYGGTYDTAKFYIVGSDTSKPLTISDYRSEVFDIDNAVIPTKRKVNREASKIARANHKPFLEFARGFMEVLNLDVPKNNDLTWWVQREYITTYDKDPSAFPEEKYLDLLSAMVHRGYYAMSFKQIKNMLAKDGTIYERVELPIGTCQKQ